MSAWGDYLKARHVLIHEWTGEQGMSAEQIVDGLSVDVTEVQLVVATPLERGDEYAPRLRSKDGDAP